MPDATPTGADAMKEAEALQWGVKTIRWLLRTENPVGPHAEFEAAVRKLVEAHPAAGAGEAVTWQSLGELHIDAWGRGQARAHAVEHGGRITIEVTDGDKAWRATIPAPWVKVAAPAAPLVARTENDA